jgi:SAM-dependent methyltransferase
LNWRVAIDKWLSVSVRRHHLDVDLEDIKMHMMGKVLEIGAGKAGRRGDFQPPIREAKQWTFLNLSRKVQPDIQADVSFLPFPPQRFETVVCLEVMEYVLNPNQALIEIGRILKVGGILVLSVPFMHRQDTEGDYWRFTQSGICYLLEKNGFQVTWLKKQGAALAVAVNILKFAINARKDSSRLIFGRLARPALNALWKRDYSNAKKTPILSTFTTGFLVVAKSIQHDD